MKTSDSHDRQKSSFPDRLWIGTKIPGDVDTVHHFAVQCPIDRVSVVCQLETIATTATQDFVDFLFRPVDPGGKGETGNGNEWPSRIYRLFV